MLRGLLSAYLIGVAVFGGCALAERWHRCSTPISVARLDRITLSAAQWPMIGVGLAITSSVGWSPPDFETIGCED